MTSLLALLAALPPSGALLLTTGRLPYRHWLVLLGMAGCGIGGMLAAPAVGALFAGRIEPLFLGLEGANLAAFGALFVLLRARLGDTAVHDGLYRDLLDFVSLSRWHPAVTAALVLVVVLPLLWFGSKELWLFGAFARRGPGAFASGDVRSSLEGLAAVVTVSLAAGVPLLFLFHLWSRRIDVRRALPWLLLPLLLVAAGAGFVLLVTVAHFAQ